MSIPIIEPESSDSTPNDGYSFVKVSELKSYMSGIGLDADQADSAQTILDGLQRDLERYCQRRFERKVRTEWVHPTEGGFVFFRATPVVSVSAPVVLDAAMYGDSLTHLPVDVLGYWGMNPFAVTYLGGLDPEGDDLHDVRLAILRVATREVTTRHDDTLDPNDLQARKVDPADRRALGWTDDEKKAFDRLRRRTAV